MIAWLNPAALIGIAAVAIPIAIHFLRQQRASRVLFPSLRFVHPSRAAAMRLRRVSDPWLLLLRMLVLALAAIALAQPVIVTPWRLSAWNARVARATVLDTSESLRLHGAGVEAREAADAESRTAAWSRRIETTDLRAGVRQAAVWLAAAPPARREMVIVSDFQAGALARADLDEVPEIVGIRAVQAGGPKTAHNFSGVPLMAAPGSLRRTDIRLDPLGTQVTISTGPIVPAASGLRVMTAAQDHEAAQALVRTVAAAGTPAPSEAEPIAAVFVGAQPPGPLRPIAAGWMLGTVVRLMEDAELRAASALVSAPEGGPADAIWTVVSRDAQQRPVVRAAAAGSELAIDVAGPAGSYLAAAALRGVLLARRRPADYAEQDILRTPPQELAAWSRAPAPVGREVAVHADRTDARWFWTLALIALVVETRVRRSRPAPARETQADAA